MKALGCEHHAGFHQFFVELAHFCEQFPAWQRARLGIFAGFDNDHDFHFQIPLQAKIGSGRYLFFLPMNSRSGVPAIDIGAGFSPPSQVLLLLQARHERRPGAAHAQLLQAAG